ncbi:transposase [Pedobacter frigiditerrae]|uniref:transposase n=1 Tax=Pedobacter frigiditerrae TaxID=2530452 RepID=UPI00292CC612|nr:transposase [Pedobacter frigiditerrae]
MEFIEDSLYHIYNRGNNKQQIFFTDENYLFFLKKVRSELIQHCEILSYCLMPNHFHFIVLAKSKEDGRIRDLNSAIGILLRSYTRAMQKQENFKGSLFQQKTKAKKLAGNANETVSYLSICAHYIHQNPQNAGLVNSLKDWAYSSYLDYAGIRNGTLCNQELFYAFAGVDKEQFLIESENFVSEKLEKDLF